MKTGHFKIKAVIVIIAMLLAAQVSAESDFDSIARGAILTKDDQAIAISESESVLRNYPLNKTLSPTVGYIRSDNDGKKGLEKYGNSYLSKGYTMHLTIDAALQQRVEAILDRAKENLKADDIITAMMESRTGKVLAIASSNRYDPMHITEKDVPSLNLKFAEYPYEPGSVIKPLTLAIALDHHLLTPDIWFETFGGRLSVGKNRAIADDEKFEGLSATDIIVHSSNVGISQISWLLTGKQFSEGLRGFGLGEASGIDLDRDLPGRIKPITTLNHKMHRANTAYGYGMHATFAQLLKAYSAFNNDGIAVTPRIIDYFTDEDEGHHTMQRNAKDRQAVSKAAAKQIHDILLEVVKRGTGLYAQTPGLEIGGKTGTAHIATKDDYPQEFHSSFYGFANDNTGHKYTIGVLVIRAKKENAHFASLSAVPVFKEIVGEMVEMGYLEPEKGE